MAKLPEHFDLRNPLYLPVSRASCDSLLKNEAEACFDNMSDAELAAVLVIQNLSSAQVEASHEFASEIILTKLIKWGLERSVVKGVSLKNEALRLFDIEKFKVGLNVLRASEIELLSDADVAVAKYLLSNGEWDPYFKIRNFNKNDSFVNRIVTPAKKEIWLSSEQNLLLRTFQANIDESLHIQGYAGVGKTHLISSLLAFLDRSKVLVLANTVDKLVELKTRSKLDYIKGFTFEMFALRLLEERFGKQELEKRRTMRDVSNLVVARELGFLAVQGLNAERVAEICMKIVDAYCGSSDFKISERHFPVFKKTLSLSDKSVLLEFSNRIWSAMDLASGEGFILPLKGIRLVKKASLVRAVIPRRYTHVLIDESHDLPASLLSIIERNSQALITLGDEYQRLHGRDFNRRKDVRQKEVTHSVRAGESLEQILNTLIYAHPQKLKLPFEAARDVSFEVFRYDGVFLPEVPLTILVSSAWDMFRWFKFSSGIGCSLSFIGKSGENFKKFMESCIRLFREGTPSTHELLYQYDSWGALSLSEKENQSFRWLESEMMAGYKISDLNSDMLSVSGGRGGEYRIGAVEDVGNMEFDSVLISPGLMDYTYPKTPYEVDLRISTLYTAASRAKHKLYIPGDVDEWVGFCKSNSSGFNNDFLFR